MTCQGPGCERPCPARRGGRGRHPRYCSNACRQAAYRARLAGRELEELWRRLAADVELVAAASGLEPLELDDRDVECPTCAAPPGRPCLRPSGQAYESALHDTRRARAERFRSLLAPTNGETRSRRASPLSGR